MRRWVVVLVVILLAGAAVMGARSRRTPAAPPAESGSAAVPVEVAAVEVGAVARLVDVTGTVTSARTAEVYPKISGRVARVYVQDGARVAAGQALIELDASEQRAELAQAEAAVAAAQARLTALERGLRPQERQVIFNNFTQAQNQVKAAETQVAVAQASLRVAEDNLRRHEQLLRDGAVAQAQVDQARLQADQARAQLQAAQTQLEIARTALDSARQQWNMTETGTRAEELQAARAQVAQARALAALTRQRVANMVIRAPFAGRVSGVTASVGDFLRSGDFPGGGYVALVYDDLTMEVEVKVGERDLALIKPGQRATLQLEDAAGKEVGASVRTIAPAADPASRAATVRLRLRTGGDLARPGTFARGAIVVEERTGVLLVPKVAVLGEGQPIVRVVANDTVQVRPVTVGVAQGERVEIRTGVTAGERVVVLGPEVLASGTKVRVVNR
jgi:multidrug efflux pump subunit AcrA (membrane-fusion protein)